MPDTHINAFFGAVDEAKAKVATAKGELAAAEAALETKKKEVGYVEPEEVKPEASVQEETAPVEVKSSVFKKR